MNAKEMFEKLDYSWEETKDYIKYTKYNWKHWIFNSKTTIYFWKVWSEIQIYSDFAIHIDLLQAINKQVEELGWYE